MELTNDEKQELLRIARRSIEAAIQGTPLERQEPANQSFLEPRGAFVTLHLEGELRGCIGYVEPRLQLAIAIEEVAAKAALEDPRFYPLSSEEFDSVEIEVSILSPLKKISDINEIEVGKHGLIIDTGYKRGLLLPQVAVEYEWTREEFLSHTAQKAGLPANAWRDKAAEIFIFTTDVFSEAEFKKPAL